MTVALIILIVGGITGIGSAEFTWLRDHLIVPAGKVTYLVALFTLAVCYFRSLRIRTLETAVLTIAVALETLYNMPVTTVSPEFKSVALWYLDYVVTGASRAIVIGLGLGMIVMALRGCLGLQRALGGRE